MGDLLKHLQRCTDKDILSEKVLENTDRDIIPIVVQCYASLRDTFLAGFSIEVADQNAQFKMEYKEYLKKVEGTKLEPKITTDIAHLENCFYELKLKYVMDPFLLKDDWKISAIDNTIASFKEEVSGYTYKNKSLVKNLQSLRKIYLERIPNIKTKYTYSPTSDIKEGSKRDEAGYSLFVEEQSVIIPIIHKTGKYKIDGYNYYGVYNDAQGYYITADNSFSFKIMRRGKMGTYYLFIDFSDYKKHVEEVNSGKKKRKNLQDSEVLYIRFFGYRVNPFYILAYTNQVLKDTPMEDIIDTSEIDNEEFIKLLRRTYEEAQEMEAEGFKYDAPGVHKLGLGEEVFRKQFVDYIRIYSQILDDNLTPSELNQSERTFVHLSNLEESITNAINGNRKIIKSKKIPPSELVKRKNLSPMNIYTTIKQGFNSSASSQTQMFDSTTTSPNPIDLFKLFQYNKITNHTETTKKPHHKMKNNQVPLESQLVKYNNMQYLGTFAPKNATNKDASAVLHFNIPDDNIVQRDTWFEDIFATELE